MTKHLFIDIHGCARCGGIHKHMEFKPFKSPTDEASHWTLCPATSEPLFLRMVEGPPSPQPASDSPQSSSRLNPRFE